MTPSVLNRALVVGVLLILLVVAWIAIGQRRAEALVVYCAHDLMFAEQVLEDFQRETGIKVVVVGDTEATKSLGLVQRILRERDNPQCDLFWNNQVLGTVELAEAGVLEPYQGAGFSRMPERYKDPDGLWVGFAGRLRVWIVNTDKMSADEETVLARYAADDLSRMTIAMPLYGTTLSHFSMLWGELGAAGAQEWFNDLRARGCKLSPGNATVKNLVAEGVCDFGWTDTDDYFVAIDDKQSVAMLPIRHSGKTLCIPNSVAIIKGTKQRVAAEKLVDYLTSARIELVLAESQARQIPLGPHDPAELPEDVRLIAGWAEDSIDIRQYATARQACLNWIQATLTSSTAP